MKNLKPQNNKGVALENNATKWRKEKRKGGKIFIVALKRLRKKCAALHQPVVFGFVLPSPLD